MMDLQLSFHHIGIACRDIEKTKAFYLELGYTATSTVDDPLQHVRVVFLDKPGEPRLELLEPIGNQSPVLRTLSAVGVSPYHMCYEVSDMDETIVTLREHRFLLVNGPVPACAMNNCRVAFLFNKNTGLIELVEAKH